MSEYDEMFDKNYVSKKSVAIKLNQWIIEFGVLSFVVTTLSLFGLVFSISFKAYALSGIFFIIICANVFFFLKYLLVRFKYLRQKYFSKINNSSSVKEELI
jgi:hypothetical protein